MKNNSGNSTPRICIGLIFNQGGSLVSAFGFKDFFDPCLLAGFSYALKSFINQLSSFLPDIDIEEQNNIFNNFLNTGFYLKQFKNKKDGKIYGIIFRPKNTILFFEDWINKFLNKMIKQLEETDDLPQKSSELFEEFNELLSKEINDIGYVFNKKYKQDLGHKIIFRESGVRVGIFNGSKLEKMLCLIVNHLKISSELKFFMNGHIYSVDKKEIDKIEYYELKILPKNKDLSLNI